MDSKDIAKSKVALTPYTDRIEALWWHESRLGSWRFTDEVRLHVLRTALARTIDAGHSIDWDKPFEWQRVSVVEEFMTYGGKNEPRETSIKRILTIYIEPVEPVSCQDAADGSAKG